MGAIKRSRPTKSGTNKKAVRSGNGSDDGWSSSAASDFVPAKRGKTARPFTRNKKLLDDKVTKSQHDIEKPAKAALKSRTKFMTSGRQVALTAAALERHNASFDNDNINSSSFTHPIRTINGLEMSRLTDALDLQYRGPSIENFGDYKADDFSDASSVGGEPMMANTGRVSRPKKAKGAALNANGRVVGRKLVKWHRSRMAEKLLLHVQYECHRRNIALPWDKIVKRLSPGSSGFSALQHMNKLRDMLVTEGHMVPPLLGKKHVPQDPSIRGFIRDMNGELPNSTRVVRWGEHIEDRKHNLVVPGLVRGSGTYPRKARAGETKTLETATKLQGQRRDRRPIELRDVPKITPKPLRPGKPGPKPGSKSRKIREAQLPAAATELFDNSNVRGGYGLRKTEPKRFKQAESLDVDVDVDINDNDDDASMATSAHQDLTERMTPPRTMPVTLHLAPHQLSKFPKGSSRGNGVSADQYNSDSDSDEYTPVSEVGSKALKQEQHDHQLKKPVRNNKQAGKQRIGAHQYPQTPSTTSKVKGHSYTSFNPNVSVFTALDSGFIACASQYGRDVNTAGRAVTQCPSVTRRKAISINEFEAVACYEGRDEHGTMTEYLDALRHGEDPRINGLIYKNLPAKVQERASIKLGATLASVLSNRSEDRGNDQVQQHSGGLSMSPREPKNDMVTKGIDTTSQISGRTNQSVSTSQESVNTSHMSTVLVHSLDDIKSISEDKSRVPQPNPKIHGPPYGGVPPRNTVSLMDIESGAAYQAQQRLIRIDAETPTIVKNPDGTIEAYRTWQSEEDFQQPADTQMWNSSNQFNAAGILSPPSTFDPYPQMPPSALQQYHPSSHQNMPSNQSAASSLATEDQFSGPSLVTWTFGTPQYGAHPSLGSSFRDVDGSNLFPIKSFQQSLSNFGVQGNHAFDQIMQTFGDDDFTNGHHLSSHHHGDSYQSLDSVMGSVETDVDDFNEPRMLETPNSMSSNAFPSIQPYDSNTNHIDCDCEETQVDHKHENIVARQMDGEYRYSEYQY